MRTPFVVVLACALSLAGLRGEARAQGDDARVRLAAMGAARAMVFQSAKGDDFLLASYKRAKK